MAVELRRLGPRGGHKPALRHLWGGGGVRACDSLVGPPDLFSTPCGLINTETSRKKPRSGVPPPQACVATKNQSGARFGTLSEEESISNGHLHHPGGHRDEEGVVHPRG